MMKIITVDDSAIVAERLKSMLTNIEDVSYLGNASNIPTALILISTHNPDIVILDIHLTEEIPKMNGIDLLVMLRKNYPDMIIMMLTNMANEQYRNTCITYGANYFLDKSNDFDQIPEILTAIVPS